MALSAPSTCRPDRWAGEPDPGLDEYVFRFNRRTARSISHGFARLVEQAVRTKPATYRAIVAATGSA